MPARIAPAEPPFAPEVQRAIDAVMRGRPPLLLFRTLARDRRLFTKFFGGGLLDPGHLTLRQREIVIGRTTARCGSEYEWGVHIAAFAQHANITDEQGASLVRGGPLDECWSDADSLLIMFCDALHETCTVDDQLWRALQATFADDAIVELLMLAGFYRTVSYLTNALQLPPEPGARRFPRCSSDVEQHRPSATSSLGRESPERTQPGCPPGSLR